MNKIKRRIRELKTGKEGLRHDLHKYPYLKRFLQGGYELTKKGRKELGL